MGRRPTSFAALAAGAVTSVRTCRAHAARMANALRALPGPIAIVALRRQRAAMHATDGGGRNTAATIRTIEQRHFNVPGNERKASGGRNATLSISFVAAAVKEKASRTAWSFLLGFSCRVAEFFK